MITAINVNMCEVVFILLLILDSFGVGGMIAGEPLFMGSRRSPLVPPY